MFELALTWCDNNLNFNLKRGVSYLNCVEFLVGISLESLCHIEWTLHFPQNHEHTIKKQELFKKKFIVIR